MNWSAVRVLLVEDDLFFASRIMSVLNKLGCAADRASNLPDAVRKAKDENPDVVILSFGSKQVGGLGAIRRLKNEAGAQRVLAYYSHVKIPEIRDQALAAGVNRIVPNSVITMRLPDILERTVRGESDLDSDQANNRM